MTCNVRLFIKMMMNLFRRGGNFLISLSAIISNTCIFTADRFHCGGSNMYHLLRHFKTLRYAHVIFYVSLWFLKLIFTPPPPHGKTASCGPGPPHYRGFTITLRQHHTRQDFSGRVISPSQRPLPDNTQYSQETDIHALYGIRTCNSSKRAAADLRGNWDRLLLPIPSYYFCV
jgi:hypothetical protein